MIAINKYLYSLLCLITNKFIKYLAFCTLCLISAYSKLYSESIAIHSTCELDIGTFPTYHRFGLYAVNICLKTQNFPFKQLNTVKEEVEYFLSNYPNQEDYWEFVNLQLANHLLKHYPGLYSFELTLAIESDSIKPFARKSTVLFKDKSIQEQKFSFTIANQPLNKQLIEMEVEMNYSATASIQDYLNFFEVNNNVQEFIQSNELLSLPTPILLEQLAKHLLSKFLSPISFKVKLKTPLSMTQSSQIWSVKASREPSFSLSND